MARNVTELQRPNDVPEKIGKYVIINKIGRGSTGSVFLSHDPYYRRDVAIKVYNAEEDQDADRARVLLEGYEGACCGQAASAHAMALARIGVGVGEAGCTPPAHS